MGETPIFEALCHIPFRPCTPVAQENMVLRSRPEGVGFGRYKALVGVTYGRGLPQVLLKDVRSFVGDDSRKYPFFYRSQK